MLAWHVDYWDYLGWKDPFGSKEATERQKGYAKARGLKGLQTPHFFVANRPVNGAEIKEAVRKEADAKACFAIAGRAVLGKKVVFEGTVKVVGPFEEEVPPIADPPRNALTVQVVLYAKKAETKCTAGENKGRTLVEFFAVVAQAKRVKLADAFKKGVKAEFDAPEGIAELGVAILVEDAAKMETLECAAFPVRPS